MKTWKDIFSSIEHGHFLCEEYNRIIIERNKDKKIKYISSKIFCDNDYRVKLRVKNNIWTMKEKGTFCRL